MQNACTHRSHHFGFARCEPYRTELRCRRQPPMPFNRQKIIPTKAETPCRILLGSKTSELPDVHVSRLSSCVLISISLSDFLGHLAFSRSFSLHCRINLFIPYCHCGQRSADVADRHPWRSCLSKRPGRSGGYRCGGSDER